MTRFNFREAEIGDDELDDGEERRDIVRDGQGIRVRLMHADSAPPVTWVAPIRDSAPPRSTFDPTVLQRPGYRTVEMVRDCREWLDQQSGADPAHEARQQRIARQSTMWRDNIYINYSAAQVGVQEAGGGQSSNGDPDELEAERDRVNRERGGGVYPDPDEGSDTRDAAYAAKQRRLADAWRSPVQSSTEARLPDTVRPFTAPVADRRGTPIRDATEARDAAYAERCARLTNAWQAP
jgi:hypothetical protein